MGQGRAGATAVQPAAICVQTGRKASRQQPLTLEAPLWKLTGGSRAAEQEYGR